MAIEEINTLKELDFTKQLTFAYLTCERLYPNYVYFSQNYDFGNPNVIREAIDFVYNNLFEKNPDQSKINFFSKEIEKNTPDPGEFETALASSALDVCTSTFDSLNFLSDRKFARIKDISAVAFDTVDMYIRDLEPIDVNKDRNYQQKLAEYPLMKKELSIQKGIINFLKNSKNLDYNDIQTLLNLQENNKKSNLDL